MTPRPEEAEARVRAALDHGRDWAYSAPRSITRADLRTLLSMLDGARTRALKLVGYAVHDDDCTVNRYPEHEACSCGLRLILQEVRHNTQEPRP